MTAAEAIHAAELLLVLVLIGLLRAIELVNMLIEKLQKTGAAWKELLTSWRQDPTQQPEDEANNAEPDEPHQLPPR
ncbi:hypothetical protein GCM10009837_87750 [Streptomyces durmitorensis]|uniref:Uncharacterized protein n=1 Tax=Streptomyces durmitorensis TaxID=319947 RepID=A0ABY4Q724_9ACTN|nr:hypothetical protein [Streptomyces durmitorensis]UQT61988.1 hypothetical protein M4V62_43445 [Streptomyces durmitorensis]